MFDHDAHELRLERPLSNDLTNRPLRFLTLPDFAVRIHPPVPPNSTFQFPLLPYILRASRMG